MSLCVVSSNFCVGGSILPELLNMLEGKGMRVLPQVFSLENIKKHQGNDALPNVKHFLFLFFISFYFILFYFIAFVLLMDASSLTKRLHELTIVPSPIV